MLSLAFKAFPPSLSKHISCCPCHKRNPASPRPLTAGAASTGLFPSLPAGPPTDREGSRRLYLLGESSLNPKPEIGSPSVEFLSLFSAPLKWQMLCLALVAIVEHI